MRCLEVDERREFPRLRFADPRCHGGHFALGILRSALCSIGMQLDTTYPSRLADWPLGDAHGVFEASTRGRAEQNRTEQTHLLFEDFGDSSSP